ncbi:hypothetical protein EZS27_036327, partial [termite gut metagenome]
MNRLNNIINLIQMKKIFLFLVSSTFILFFSCSNEQDKYYNDNGNNEEASPLTLQEYLSGESNFSEFYKLLQSSGVVPELGKNQYLTVWAVGNENYDHDPFEGISDILLGGYHANYLAFGMNDLRPGLRIQCLNNIYITIGSKDDGDYVNDAKILSSKKFKNGVVYEISELMRPRTNIFEFIQMLGDEYSVIRDSILCNNTRLFDKANSIPIGVDQTGNTVYDSIFYISNPLFD